MKEPTKFGKLNYKNGLYAGCVCTCSEKCPCPCKGECGCEACIIAHTDYLRNN